MRLVIVRWEFGDMRPRIRLRLNSIHLRVGENLGKNPTRRLATLLDGEEGVYKSQYSSNGYRLTGTKQMLCSNAGADRCLHKTNSKYKLSISLIELYAVFDILCQRENAVHIKSTTLPCEAILDYEFNYSYSKGIPERIWCSQSSQKKQILGLVNKLETTGSLVSEKGKHRSSRVPTVIVDVRARLEQLPKKSLRRLSQETRKFESKGIGVRGYRRKQEGLENENEEDYKQANGRDKMTNQLTAGRVGHRKQIKKVVKKKQARRLEPTKRGSKEDLGSPSTCEGKEGNKEPQNYSLRKEKDDHIKDSLYEELEQTFDQLPRYHMKFLLGDFNAKVGWEDIFKPTIGKESLVMKRDLG
ncbi:hypothetical protein ANN_24138 [Periplaneta americana]|uniref:Endonuclease/exonuclease/phosphatase domain-containing protein n=1 Tax=Periplaneta americana TaxID=6978 RepID=A0ABQ8S286_PERAM|nr:hypothetical protein ANN_24138 [Periplaneta americana]